ncbi:zinc finger MYM-type protein 6-like [Tachypleus tridentatus]|uniref:zinc finger MYM-type protein 6-like n=1 Tax=Tachypleus tridentatus TaxID=6853 RepID=UPI003FD3833E
MASLAGTKAQDLFEILDTFLCENNLDWTKCIGICTDGGCSMSGCYGGLQALIRRKALDALWTYCIIHRDVLASKHLSPPLNLVLGSVVNFIKSEPQKAGFLKTVRIWDLSTHLFCTTVARSGSSVGMYCHVCLNYDRSSTLVLKKNKCAKNFLDTDVLSKLEYCNIFEKLNALDLSLQGSNTYILKLEGGRNYSYGEEKGTKMVAITVSSCFTSLLHPIKLF